MRGGEMAALREVPFGLYYGSVDATPLFVMLAGPLRRAYRRRSRRCAELWPDIEAALGWIDGPGDPDGDGFVEYHRADETGPGQSGLEGFRTTRSSTPTARSREGPIALAKCRAMSMRPSAWRRAARDGSAEHARGDALEAEAQQLAERFEAAFWCAEIGTYALALDGAEAALPRAHLERRAGAVQRHRRAGARAKRVDARPDAAVVSFPAGASARWRDEERRYNPMSYHNGSVWPHDNALIALGLARYGLKDAIDRVFKGLFDAATYMDLRRLPELFCGFQRGRGRGPTLYPVACSPQAWASGTPFSLIQASLGLEFDPARTKSGCAIRACRRSSTR